VFPENRSDVGDPVGGYYRKPVTRPVDLQLRMRKESRRCLSDAVQPHWHQATYSDRAEVAPAYQDLILCACRLSCQLQHNIVIESAEEQLKAISSRRKAVRAEYSRNESGNFGVANLN
jgi:hypothetical protein